jgi:hypothetical protein
LQQLPQQAVAVEAVMVMDLLHQELVILVAQVAVALLTIVHHIAGLVDQLLLVVKETQVELATALLVVDG